MTTTAYAYPGRNKLMTTATAAEYTMTATRRGEYINIIASPVSPQPDSRQSYEVGSYYIPYKSLRLNAPDAEAFRPAAERLVAKLLARAAAPKPAVAAASAYPSAAPITDAEVRAAADAALARAAAMLASGKPIAEGCGCPGICRNCGSRCYGDCHQR